MRLLQKFKRGSSSDAKGHTNYAYTVSRVRAMKSKLLPKETYPRLMNMSIDEITRFIGESGYKEDVDELAMKYDGVDLIEHALNRNLSVTFRKLLNISEGEVNFLIAEYLKEYDIWNVKTILRGKYCRASTEEILEALVAGGTLTYTFLSGLAGKETEDVISAFEGTEYYPIIKNYDGTNLSDIENQLDKLYYAGLFAVAGGSKSKDRKLFAKFIRAGIDIKNLMILFRLKKAGITDPQMMNLMIEGGLEIGQKDIQRLMPLPFGEFIEELDKYSYWKEISDIVNPGMQSLIDVETRLKKYRLKSAASFSHVYPLSIVPIMDYMLTKQNEVNNLRIIVRGKEANLSDEIIREQLVI
ncbi:V-type ATP synthase subunit C [Methanolobus chelungpuianus]|uniref:A-type ATP synthase subunit C n=1 Tax=Methanolobus chelungpuianus TaxID=502115 RepID=A0AAE3KXI9_9EURY|nr:V-type ATP synthase subunit C [Methanolobus chelungpuianus]MCQ6963006.1 ATP synthase subunit C [Methanolobus chelungpuianus]